MTPQVVVYTRVRCGLCRTAEAVVAEVCAGRAAVRHIDIDADPTITEQYTLRVPVVAIDGEEVCELGCDPLLLDAALRTAGA